MFCNMICVHTLDCLSPNWILYRMSCMILSLTPKLLWHLQSLARKRILENIHIIVFCHSITTFANYKCLKVQCGFYIPVSSIFADGWAMNLLYSSLFSPAVPPAILLLSSSSRWPAIVAKSTAV